MGLFREKELSLQVFDKGDPRQLAKAAKNRKKSEIPSNTYMRVPI